MSQQTVFRSPQRIAFRNSFLRAETMVILLLWIAFGLAMVRALAAEDPGYNLYAWLADAWLHGRLDVPADLHDAAIFEGNGYVPFPPAPALLFVPLVLVLGPESTSAIPLGLVLYCLIGLIWWRIATIRSATDNRILLVSTILLGTPLIYAVTHASGVWFFAHLFSFAALSAAILELERGGNPWIVGVLLGFSFLSRQMTIAASLYFALTYLCHERDIWSRLKDTIKFCTPVVVCVTIYLIYNFLRFSDPLDTGYDYIGFSNFLKFRHEEHGLFSYKYFTFNLWHLFMEGPHLQFEGKDLLSIDGLSRMGNSLLSTSPFLLLAITSPKTKSAVFSWISIASVLIPTLFYFNNGWTQVGGQRFTLDFLPLLLLLVCAGMPRKRDLFVIAVMTYAMTTNLVLIYAAWW